MAVDPVTPTAGGDVDVSTPKINLDVLRSIKISQNQYGVRHSSYQHYRHYCTRKLYRLRKSLKLTNGVKKYQKKEISAAAVRSERYLHIPLYQAERAWAYAMQLKDEAGLEGLAPRVYHHLIRRYAKAVKSCLELERLSTDKVNDKTKWEIQAYTCWMQGNLYLEKEEWQQAIDSFVKARTIYESITKIGDPEEQELYKERNTEIDTSLRYCQFGLNENSAEDVKSLVALVQSKSDGSFDLMNAKLESLLQESRKTQASTMEKITWRGRTVQIKSEKIRMALVGSEEIRASIETSRDNIEDKLRLYSQLFMSYGDTTEVIRKELKTIRDSIKNEKQKSSKAEFEESNIAYLLKYVSYLKLTKTIERNIYLAEQLQENLQTGAKKTKPDEIVRIYDSLIQNYTELQELDDGEDLELVKSIVAKGLLCRAKRCFYLALSFLNTHDWAKAVLLLERCGTHINIAKTHFLDCAKRDDESLQALATLSTRVEGEKYLAKAKAFLDTQEKENEQTSSTTSTLADSLDVYDTSFVNSKRLVNFPPEFVAIPNNPVLFDLANMKIGEFPDIEARKQKKGFWGRWW